MRAWIFSDLHLPAGGQSAATAVPQADVCICAGNVSEGGIVESVRWLGRIVCPHMPVIFVPGNLDYRGSSIPEVMQEGRSEARAFPLLHILDEEVRVLGGVRFVGATLWSDFALFGDQRSAMDAAANLDDYIKIKTSREPRKRFSPRQSMTLHRSACMFLEHQLAMSRGLPAVVVTHHAPSLHSVPNDWFDDPRAPTLASGLDRLILQFQPGLWVHGHIHQSREYPIGRTRVVCNARGYRCGPGGFIPDLVVDLGTETRSFAAATANAGPR